MSHGDIFKNCGTFQADGSGFPSDNRGGAFDIPDPLGGLARIVTGRKSRPNLAVSGNWPLSPPPTRRN